MCTTPAPPSTAFRFAVTGGSGRYRFALSLDGSGATVNASTGDYQAGASEGMDIVTVDDEASGEQRDARVRIVAGAVLSPAPDKVYFPVESPFLPRIRGGSGCRRFSSLPPRCSVAV